MDIIKSIISEKGADLLGGLTGAGFNMEQAKGFLPEAGSSIASAVGGEDGFDLSDITKLGDLGGIMGNIDIAGLASKTGIEIPMVENGIKSLLPMLQNFLSAGAGDNITSGLMGGMKNLFK